MLTTGGQNKNATMVQYLAVMESNDWSPHRNHALLHDAGAHQVQPRFVFQATEEAIQEDQGGWPF